MLTPIDNPRAARRRLCMPCGHIGCCDSSKNKHASRHAAAAAHPIVGSLEPGEVWQWCYLDEVAV
jgi:ubiquitin-hydrolase Zn-finger-containing protein